MKRKITHIILLCIISHLRQQEECGKMLSAKPEEFAVANNSESICLDANANKYAGSEMALIHHWRTTHYLARNWLRVMSDMAIIKIIYALYS